MASQLHLGYFSWRTLCGRVTHAVSGLRPLVWPYRSRARMTGTWNKAKQKLAHTKERRGLEAQLLDAVELLARLNLARKLPYVPRSYRPAMRDAVDALGLVPDFSTWVSFKEPRLPLSERWRARFILPEDSFPLARAFVAIVKQLRIVLGVVREVATRTASQLRGREKATPEKPPTRLPRGRDDPAWDARAAFAALAAKQGPVQEGFGVA